MWLTQEEAACPIETEEVRRRYSWKVLLAAPWHAVETLLWGVAAAEPRYLQEVPVVLAEVEAARTQGLQVAR
ncbi:hypothetical protein SAMN04488069_12917 [Hymenobacter psychrophilus]|uniref:Uncharacterized protein n=2 Tax=Hymenobacter psychrophilus TaxID=651662 RepID=A0A1H3PE14_9BACT|nr:hypothetical protein SAMN04488069_12917 [Hymenobacter psychrophilus]